MSLARVILARIHGLFTHDRHLSEELQFHLDMQTEDNIKLGMPPSEARRAALRAFGPVESTKETYRDRRTLPFLESIVQDLRFAIRSHRRSPGFTLTAITVLALAIGVNTAMFSVLDATLLRPLPYPAPEQLAMLWTEIPSQQVREGRTSFWNAEQWRAQSRNFSSMAMFDPASVTLTGREVPEQISVVRATPNIFSMLGIRPALGRTFGEEEAGQGQRLALISHRLWQSHFGGSATAIGASIELNGIQSQIIGVLPPDTQLLRQNVDIWQPHTLVSDWQTQRGVNGAESWFVIGRLVPGASIVQVQSEMSSIASRLGSQGISVMPLSLHLTGPSTRLALWLLSAAVFCVLLIAITNVASLTLARGASRQREISIRASLGASRARILRQLLLESIALTLVAGSFGLLVAQAGIEIARTFAAPTVAIQLDQRALASTLALCLVTGALIGLTPGLTKCKQATNTRRTLVIAEFALAITLLFGAGLLIRSLRSVERVDTGWNASRVLSLQLSTSRRPHIYSQIVDQIQSLPGVEKAGIISEIFLGGNSEQTITVEGEGRTTSDRFRFRSDEVTGGLFATIGTPLLKGRFFTTLDRPESPLVAIINEVMARRLWPDRDPIGHRFKFGGADSSRPWFTVVGVVADMRRQGLETAPIAQMFQPLVQNPSRLVTLLVRTSSSDPFTMAGPIQAAVHSVEKQTPVYGITTLERRLDGFLSQRRFQTSLLTAFAAAAVLMAAIGIFGLIQFSVVTRTKEIGIRMAVGAKAADIFRMVIAEGLKLSLAGLAIGLIGALWLARTGRTLLYGVTAADPLTLVTVTTLLVVISIAACTIPAHRAMKIEPLFALRRE